MFYLPAVFGCPITRSNEVAAMMVARKLHMVTVRLYRLKANMNIHS